MKNAAIKIGTKLTLTYKQPGKLSEEFHTKIIDKQQNYLIIDYPIHTKTKKTKYLSVGTAFKASWVEDDDAIFEFSSKVIKKVRLKYPAIAIQMPNPDEIKRIQRREYARVDSTLDVAIYPHDDKNNGFTTVTSDISGGGLSIVVPKNRELTTNKLVDVWMVLGFKTGKYHYVQTTAEVVFIREMNGIKTASLKFINLKPVDQQLVVSFCFEKQRELRKKELS